MPMDVWHFRPDDIKRVVDAIHEYGSHDVSCSVDAECLCGSSSWMFSRGKPVCSGCNRAKSCSCGLLDGLSFATSMLEMH